MTTAAPDATGTLGSHCLPRVLFFLFQKQYTGVLELDTSAKKEHIFVHQGMPVMAEISESVESVAEVLLRTGVLPHEKYHQAMYETAQSGESLGAVLLRLGAASEEQVENATRQVVFKRLMRLFRIKDAPFAIYPGDHQYVTSDAASNRVKLHPRRIIYHGIRNAYDLGRINLELAGHLEGRCFQIEPTGAQEIPNYFFDREDEVVLELLRRAHWTVSALSDAANRGELEILMIVYTLLVTEMLDLREGTDHVGLQPKSPGVASTADRSGTDRQAGQSPGFHAQGGVSGQHAAVGASGRRPVATPSKPGERTGTRPGSYRSAIRPEAIPVSRTGLREPTKTFRPGLQATEKKPDPEQSALAQQIRERVENLDKKNHFEVLGVPNTASKEAIKSAYLTLAKTFHPDRLAQHGLEAQRADVERLFSRITEAHSVLSDDQRRAQYAATFERGSPADQEKARRIIDGETSFQRGLASMRGKKFAEAEAAFRHAAELNPEEGEHYAMLGWSMYNNPAHARAGIIDTVKQHLLKAIKMSPNNPTPLYLLGEVYLAESDLDRALAQFKRTLELKDGHVEAERGVRLVMMRKDKGTDRKGLFDRLRKK